MLDTQVRKFILLMIEDLRTTRPDLVTDRSMILSNNRDDYIQKLLIMYRASGKLYGFTMNEEVFGNYLSKAVETKQIIFREMNGKDDITVYSVYIPEYKE